MNCGAMMSGSGGMLMMGGMAVEWLILLVLEVLAIAALIKYLRSPGRVP
ncbi:hypothetical protein LJR225_005196 [Phenylobacterium sp. LjRoot225]